jgi:hypothetical protein
MWSYMLSVPRVTRNSTDITIEKATVPNTTNVSPFSTIAVGALSTLRLLPILVHSATLKENID